MLPRSGAGTRRQSSHAARAAATAWSTSAAVERGNDSITSPVDGFRDSKVAVAMPAIVAGRRPARRREPPQASCASVSRKVPGTRAPAAVTRLALLGELVAVPAVVPAVGPVAPVDDHRHVRVVTVVLDHLVVELAPRAHAGSRSRSRSQCTSRGGGQQTVLEVVTRARCPGTIRPSSVHVRVPLRERALELARVVPALLEPDRVVRVRARRGTGTRRCPRRRSRRPRRSPPRARSTETAGLPERLADPADRAPVLRRVEQIGRLDDRELLLGQPAQDRLRRDRLGSTRAASCRAASRAAAAARRRRRVRARSAWSGAPSRIQPYSTRRLGAERADVDVVGAAVRREADRPFADQQRALADRARTLHGHPCDAGHCRQGNPPARRDVRPARPPSPSSPPRSAFARCARALPRSAGTACGSRRGRR